MTLIFESPQSSWHTPLQRKSDNATVLVKTPKTLFFTVCNWPEQTVIYFKPTTALKEEEEEEEENFVSIAGSTWSFVTTISPHAKNLLPAFCRHLNKLNKFLPFFGGRLLSQTQLDRFFSPNLSPSPNLSVSQSLLIIKTGKWEKWDWFDEGVHTSRNCWANAQWHHHANERA